MMASRKSLSRLVAGIFLSSLALALPAQAEIDSGPLSTEQTRAMSAEQLKDRLAQSIGRAQRDIAEHRKESALTTLANAETSLLNAQMADTYYNGKVFNAVQGARSDLIDGKTADARRALQTAQQKLSG